MDDFTSLIGEPPKKVMDAGCGTGKVGVYLAELGYSVFCLDLSEGMLKEAIQNAQEKQVAIYPVQANMRSQCFANGSLDAIWSMASLVHMDKSGKERAIHEFSRMLAPGGLLHISAQNMLHGKHLRRILQSYNSWLGYDEDNNYYQRRKTREEMRDDIGLAQRLKQGYAYLDDRHWYFPTKPILYSLLKKHGFKIIRSNSIIAKRSVLLAVKR